MIIKLKKKRDGLGYDTLHFEGCLCQDGCGLESSPGAQDFWHVYLRMCPMGQHASYGMEMVFKGLTQKQATRLRDEINEAFYYRTDGTEIWPQRMQDTILKK